MPFQIVRNDITKMAVDVIVNAANKTLLGGGGVDGAIHRAAGPALLEECKTLGGCKTGEAKLTKGYNLPSKYVIHTVGPIWQGGSKNEEQLLTNCYINSLNIAKQNGFESVAFPLISSGAYGYPKYEALKIASQVIQKFIYECDMMVYLVVFDKDSFVIGNSLFEDVERYIDDYYVDIYSCERSVVLNQECCSYAPMSTIDDVITNTIDESFSQMLLRKIDEKGITDAQCYKKANIDKKLFSKIRTNASYKPSKATVCAFIIALELPMDEANDMLRKAGFAFSHSNIFDIIVEYFIKTQNYDIFEINEVLFAKDQLTLGSK